MVMMFTIGKNFIIGQINNLLWCISNTHYLLRIGYFKGIAVVTVDARYGT